MANGMIISYITGKSTMSKIDLKLAAAESRAKMFETAYLATNLILLLAVGVGVFHYYADSGYVVVNLMIAIFWVVIFGMAVQPGMLAACKFARHRWFPSYYIDEQPGILRVVGTVGLGDGEYDLLEAKLIRMRPNYKLADDAFARFGCTMAAVPATDEYLRGRDAYNALMSQA